MSLPEDEIQYFINTKRSVMVVSFVGRLTESNQSLLKKCLDEVRANMKLRFVILNLQGLTDIENASIRNFTLMQSAIREDFKVLVCCLSAELKKTLSGSGVLRENELEADLRQALQVILKLEGGK